MDSFFVGPKKQHCFIKQIDSGTKRDELARNTLGTTTLPHIFAGHWFAWNTILISYINK